MSRIGKMARRTFLIGSAAVAGGVAFGIYAARSPFPNPNLENLPEGSASFKPLGDHRQREGHADRDPCR